MDASGNPAILIYDIEVTDLNGDFGQLLVFGWKWLGMPAEAKAIYEFKGWKKDLTDDSNLVRFARDILGAADLRVGYYSTGFDRPYMTAKFFEHDIPLLDNTPEIDLYYHAKAKLKISRRSLDNVSRFMKLPGKKVPIDALTWRQAKVGQKEAIETVKAHCLADLELTEQLYLKLRPIIATHPRVASFYNCHACGSNHLTYQGYKMTKTKGNRVRIKCSDCGAWMTFAESDVVMMEAQGAVN